MSSKRARRKFEGIINVPDIEQIRRPVKRQRQFGGDMPARIFPMIQQLVRQASQRAIAPPPPEDMPMYSEYVDDELQPTADNQLVVYQKPKKRRRPRGTGGYVPKPKRNVANKNVNPSDCAWLMQEMRQQRKGKNSYKTRAGYLTKGGYRVPYPTRD